METNLTGIKDLRKDIESHSSALTNLRIADIKKAVCSIGFRVMSSKPNPISRLEFFSVILEYYLETKDVYGDDLDTIDKQIKRGNQIAALLRVKGTATRENMESLLQICLRLQHMINTSLQKRGYFFRLGKRDPKGIDAALAIFEERAWEKKDETKTAKAKA